MTDTNDKHGIDALFSTLNGYRDSPQYCLMCYNEVICRKKIPRDNSFVWAVPFNRTHQCFEQVLGNLDHCLSLSMMCSYSFPGLIGHCHHVQNESRANMCFYLFYHKLSAVCAIRAILIHDNQNWHYTTREQDAKSKCHHIRVWVPCTIVVVFYKLSWPFLFLHT